MRHFSIDELPSLWNIVNGEMSFVGPRPLPPVFYKKKLVSDRRLLVKPGLTGLAQVKGRNSLSYRNREKFDLFYIERQKKICLKLAIIFRTVFQFRDRRQ